MLIRVWEDEDDIVTVLPAGAVLPDGLTLTLVQNGRRNYCLEATKRCTIQEFNRLLKDMSPLLEEMTVAEFRVRRGERCATC